MDEFTTKLKELLRLKDDEAVALVDLLEDRIKEIAEERANDALDRTFNRGNYRY